MHHQTTAQGRYNQKLRIEVLKRYGGSPPKCSCCAESNIEFLTIDHIEGGAERKITGRGFYMSLKKAGWPERPDLRVLCMNCNMSYGMYGYCPHVYYNLTTPEDGRFVPRE